MKKLMVAFLMIVGLSGCGGVDRSIANITGYAKSCVDGVQYLQFVSGVTVQYNQSGQVVTCR